MGGGRCGWQSGCDDDDADGDGKIGTSRGEEETATAAAAAERRDEEEEAAEEVVVVVVVP